MFRNKEALNNSPFLRFALCFGLSIGVLLISSVIFAIIANSLDDPTGKLGIFSLLAMLISAAVSGYLCSRIKGEGGVGFAALVALALLLIMLLINVIICSGKISFAAFMNYICYFGVASLSALLGGKGKGHKKHRHKH